MTKFLTCLAMDPMNFPWTVPFRRIWSLPNHPGSPIDHYCPRRNHWTRSIATRPVRLVVFAARTCTSIRFVWSSLDQTWTWCSSINMYHLSTTEKLDNNFHSNSEYVRFVHHKQIEKSVKLESTLRVPTIIVFYTYSQCHKDLVDL